MKRLLIAAALGASAAGLAACHGKQGDQGKSAAAAEVLPGSASDAMIAYDTLKSQPPLAQPTESDRLGGKAGHLAGDIEPTDTNTAPGEPALPSGLASSPAPTAP